MAETIKGINVVIGGETTGLNNALREVNTESRNIQSELKQVQRLLRFDPGNVELLRQQQGLLGEAVGSTRDKLNQLRAAEAQVAEQFRRGEISTGQYRAFQREIQSTEQRLEGLEDQLRHTNPELTAFATRAQEAGSNLKGTGETLTKYVTAPVAALGGIMLKGAADAQVAQGKLQASLGLTAEEAEKLEGAAKEVWEAGFGENIEEANAAIVSVKHNMAGLSDTDLPKVTESAMTIGKVFDQDVNEVVAATGVEMKNFGISGQDALDIITVGFQQGGDYSGELLDTIREYSPQFAGLGLTADQAMGMLIAGAQAGSWNLDKVGDSMKEFNIRAQDGSKTTAQGFAAIGLDAGKMGAAIAAGGDQAQQAFMATVTALASMKDPMAQNQAGVALFGTQWEDVRKNVIAALADGKNKLGEFKGATAEATKAMQENDPFLGFKQSLRELQDAVGPSLKPLSDAISNTIVPAVKAMADGFAGLSPGMRSAVVAVIGIVAAIGPLLIVFGSMATGLGSIITLLGRFNLAMLRNIAVKVADAAETLVLIGMYAKDAIARGASTVATGAMTAAQVAWNAVAVIGSTVTSALGAAFTLLAGPVGIAIAIIAGLIATGVALYENWDVVKAKLSEIWNGIKSAASTAWNSIKQAVDGPTNALKSSLTTIWNSIKGFLSGAWGSIKSTASNVWNGIKSAIETPINAAKNTVSRAINAIRGFFANLRLPAIKIPHISLPHFSISGSFSIKPPRVPHLNVSWYKTGGIFDSPSVIGVGESGAEAVLPLNKLPSLMADALRQANNKVNNYQTSNNVVNIALNNAVIRDERDIKQLARELYNLQQGAARGRGLR